MRDQPLAAPLAELERVQRRGVDLRGKACLFGRGHRLGDQQEAGDERRFGRKQFALERHPSPI